MGELSDSLHRRRFCLIALEVELPEDSTVRKLTRRPGAETVVERCRRVLAQAQRQRRLRARAQERLEGARGRHALPDPVAGRAGEGCGCGIARGRSAEGCGQSEARCGAGAARRRPSCSR